jgi:opine dehydrogenase
MNIAVLGAGSVALANACFLHNAGHDVHIWSSFADELDAIANAGGVHYEGVMSGCARINVAERVAACVTKADVVMICAPAFAHRTLMSATAPFISDKQAIVIHPVTGLSSLLLSKMLAERGVQPMIVDLSTSLFTARKLEPARVLLLRVKDLIDLATVPVRRGAEGLRLLQSIFGERFRLEKNVLAVSLNNHNPVYHVPPLLCNLSRAEKKEQWMIWECITPMVARFVKLVDTERLAVARSYGTTELAVEDYFREAHGVKGETIDDIFAATAAKLKGPIGPQTADHRFITEDVPYALVCFRSLASVAGLGMPLTDSLITITSALYGRDFVDEGHTIEALGLGGKTVGEIITTVEEGF